MWFTLIWFTLISDVPGALWGSWMWPVATTLRFACVEMEDCGGSIGWDQLDEIMGRMGS